MARFGEFKYRTQDNGPEGITLLRPRTRESLSNPDWDVTIDSRELLMRALQANLIHRQKQAAERRSRFGDDRRERLRGLFGGNG